MGVDRELFAQITVAQNLNNVKRPFCQPLLSQSLQINSVTRLKRLFQRLNIQNERLASEPGSY